MKKHAGVWIDHRKAVVVLVAEGGEKTILVESDCQKHIEAAAGSRRESGMHGSEDKRDRRFMGHLKRYYDKVITLIHGVDSILLFGPGKAKGEIRKRLVKTDLQGRIVVMETDDKMTDRQIAARVRLQFSKTETAPRHRNRNPGRQGQLNKERKQVMKIESNVARVQKKVASPVPRASGKRNGTQPVHFQVKAPPGSEVFLVGSFNGWDVKANPMRQNGQELYVADIKLPAGHHEYKFLVNGTWQMDHECTAWDPNPFGSLNSVLELSENKK